MVTRLLLPALIVGMVLFLVESGGPTSVSADPTLDNYQVTSVVDDPSSVLNQLTDFALIPGKPFEAVVTTQDDAILWRISLTGAFDPVEYGDLSTLAGGGGFEEGLLSVTFSPDFGTDGRIYVYYTRGFPDESVLSRFDATITGLTLSSEKVILEIDQTASNHNGGRILFGPDGFLYLSLGDGGGGSGSAQDTDLLLGSMLRIDVTGVTCPPSPCYTVPSDNPFVGVAGEDEIWAYGLRNPWRYSFDSVSGDLWLGDVGQVSREEVEEIVKEGNYGWDCFEGDIPYPFGQTDPCPAYEDTVPPRAVYDHSGGNRSVVGGYIYRGAAMPELYGWYIYADTYSGRIWALNPADSSAPIQLVDTSLFIASFAETSDGELLVVSFGSPPIYRLHALNSCNWRTPDIVGTSANNTLVGTSGADVINGLGGNDVITGLGGDDTLCGGAGSDIVDGGPGNDSIDGGLGSDFMHGDSGSDSVFYERGRTVGVVSAPDGTNNSGSIEDEDPITGDRDFIGTDVENLFGTEFDDTLTGSSAANVLVGSGGNDTLNGLGGNDVLFEVFFGADGGGNDTLNGGPGNDLLSGGIGDDAFDGGTGKDVMSGGAGADRVVYVEDRTEGVVAAIDGTANSGSGQDGLPGARDTIQTDIEYLFGSPYGDTLAGSPGFNILVGGAGNDTLRGLGGDDLLLELFFGLDGGGIDYLYGGDGNDTMNGGKGNDVLFGNDGDDFLDGWTGVDVCIGGIGNDTFANCEYQV